MRSVNIMDRDTKMRGFDYVVEDYKNYEKIKPYVEFPKIDKSPWRIALYDFDLEDARKIMTLKDYDFLSLELLLKKDIHSKLLQELNVEARKSKSPWEKFQERIADSQFLFDNKAAQELFKRSSGNTEKLEEILTELQSLFFDETKMTTWHLNQVSVREDKVYARDVILTVLLVDNEHIPMKGSRFSGYKYRKWEPLLEKLQSEIGDRKSTRLNSSHH